MNLYLVSALVTLIVLSSVNVVEASISATNSTGQIKNTFFTNETVYITGFSNILTNSSEVQVYIVSDSDSWSNLTNLTDVSTGIKSITTNSSGHIPTPTIIWGPPLNVGKYDVIVDINRDGKYNTSDFIDNSSTIGFEVIPVPSPSLTVSTGPNSPSDHKFNLSSGNLDNIMMQLKLVAGGVGGFSESIQLNSIGLVANGTGDDKNGISAIKLIIDSNNNGALDAGEILLGFGKFISDNGVMVLSVSSDSSLIMNQSSTRYLLIDYVMSINNYNYDTFQLQVVSVNAVGVESGKSANITGLPIYSSKTTIIEGKNKTVTIVCSDYKNQTFCPSSCQWCSSDNSCRTTTETCPIVCSGTLFLSVEQLQNVSRATVTGLSGCDNKSVNLRENSCSGATVSNCNAIGSGCLIDFATPSAGNHTYYACLDMNDSGSFESNEQSLAVLSVAAPFLPQQVTDIFSNWLIWIVVIIVIVPILVVILLLRRKPKEFSYEYKP